jgi:uncharacterized OB-fold protein
MTTIVSATYLPAGLPGPGISELDRAYWQAAKEHRLVVQACAACAAAQWPPEEICSNCHSTDRLWKQATGAGKIYSWTRIWHPVHPALQARGPYIAVVVELDDFPVLMIGNLLGEAEQEVATGMHVEAAFEDVTPEYTLVQWRRPE